MGRNMKAEELVIPIYVNEKIVLDMLAIIEDGFSTVSQVNYTEHSENSSSKKIEAGISTSATILSKLLKIDVGGEISHDNSNGENRNISQERIHTNVSLLSKFRSLLVEEKILKSDFDIKKIKIGDFIEVEGELQKSPLIDCMDKFIEMFHLAEIFEQKPPVGGRTQAKEQAQQNANILKQIKAFVEELKNSGTIDFILSDSNGTVVLSAQEQYLSNDNISEILGGRFKILGKVIAVHKEETDEIDLLRKTSLSVLNEDVINGVLSGFKTKDLEQFNLPELKTKIVGPSLIVIPVAIYA